jgi:hypothetical protein
MVPTISSASSILISQTFRYDPSCPTDKPLSGYDANCVGCEYPENIYVNDSDQKLKDYLAECSNREMDEYGNSRLKECPSDLPIKDWNSACHSCNELTEIRTTSAKDCQVCSNRTATASDSEKDYSCALTQCPADHPLFDRGDCLACDEPYRLNSSKEMCDLCPNRFYKSSEDVIESKEIDAVYAQTHNTSGAWVDIMGKKKISRVVEQSGCYLLPTDEELPIPVISTYEKSEWSFIPPISEAEIVLDGYEGGISIYHDFEKRGEDREEFKSCYENGPIATLPEFCAKCPNRVYENGKCILKECSENSYRGLEGHCLACGEMEEPRQATKNECFKCPNRMYSSKTKQCIDCRITEALDNLTKQECQRCQNRKFVDGRCVLNSCPAETMRTKQGACQKYGWRSIEDVSFDECIKGGKEYFYDIDNNICRRCDDANQEECNKHCPDYFYLNKHCTHSGNADTKEECHLAREGLWRGEKVETGLRCVDCDELDDLYISKEECDRCPNRAWDEEEKICFRCLNPMNPSRTKCHLCINKEMKNGDCVSKSCPENTFKNSFGQCISCREFFSNLWRSERGTEADCAKCPNRFYSDGECYSCQAEGAIPSSKSACAKCPDRIYKNGLCILAECREGYIHDNEGNCERCYSAVFNTTKEECNKCPENIFFSERSACMHCWMTTRKECEENEKYKFFSEKGLCCNVDFQDWSQEITIDPLNEIPLF